jgi:hypothetical protein
MLILAQTIHHARAKGDLITDQTRLPGHAMPNDTENGSGNLFPMIDIDDNIREGPLLSG